MPISQSSITQSKSRHILNIFTELIKYSSCGLYLHRAVTKHLATTRFPVILYMSYFMFQFLLNYAASEIIQAGYTQLHTNEAEYSHT